LIYSQYFLENIVILPIKQCLGLKIILTIIIGLYWSLSFAQSFLKLGEIAIPLTSYQLENKLVEDKKNGELYNHISDNKIDVLTNTNIPINIEEKSIFKSERLFNSSISLGDYISLKGHPKAKDVNLKIKKPVGWVLEEGDRPHVVNTFVYNSNSYIILIKDNYMFVSRNEARDLIENEEFNTNFISDFVVNLKKPQIINKQIVTIDNYPALEFTVFGTKERLGHNIDMHMKYWIIYYEDKCITLLGATLNKNEFYSLENLFDSITNSIIFPEQYK
jgi:hypothetical protein